MNKVQKYVFEFTGNVVRKKVVVSDVFYSLADTVEAAADRIRSSEPTITELVYTGVSRTCNKDW